MAKHLTSVRDGQAAWNRAGMLAQVGMVARYGDAAQAPYLATCETEDGPCKWAHGAETHRDSVAARIAHEKASR